MKTTIDIPETLLREAMENTQAKTKRDAVISALEKLNHQARVHRLIKDIRENPLEFLSNDEIEAGELEENKVMAKQWGRPYPEQDLS